MKEFFVGDESTLSLQSSSWGQPAGSTTWGPPPGTSTWGPQQDRCSFFFFREKFWQRQNLKCSSILLFISEQIMMFNIYMFRDFVPTCVFCLITQTLIVQTREMERAHLICSHKSNPHIFDLNPQSRHKIYRFNVILREKEKMNKSNATEYISFHYFKLVLS